LHDALHDGLTGLPNRALLLDRIAHALARLQRRRDALFAVLFIDIDRFKNVNDGLGHMMGDQLLVAVARRLETIVSPSDTVARLGGDEFVLLLEDLESPERATSMAERIQQALRAPFDLNGQEVFTTASIGIALGSDDYFFPEEMVRDADTAMYRAKANGRARHEQFQPSMHAHAVALLQLESSLRRAVEREEFIVRYQPIVSLASGRLRGFEALVRWQHPQRGFIPPGEFVPMAEETGLIVKLGEWVLLQACRNTRAMQQRFPAREGEQPLSVSVNLSVRQFLQPDLADRVRRVLEETGLSPRSLHLEITESVIMENSTQAAALLRQLEALNVHVHLDDFGTGYSSLAYLHNFRMDALKIDGSFVRRVGQRGDGGEIVKTIVHLARDLRMEVIAEGVESAEQLAYLQSLKVDYGQGFHFAPALDAWRLEQMIATGAK
jgi:diguanylate cyclase (GGDEF)-like protein